jgi:hypothetical protein
VLAETATAPVSALAGHVFRFCSEACRWSFFYHRGRASPVEKEPNRNLWKALL